MRRGLGILFFICYFSALWGEDPVYWLIEEDFIKVGKKDLYESQIKQKLQHLQERLRLQNKELKAYALEDLENPQFAFFMPLASVNDLSLYPPLFVSSLRKTWDQSPGQSLLDTCLNFHIFSLLEYVPSSSFRPDETLTQTRPFFLYILFDIVPGYGCYFEKHIQGIAEKQNEGKTKSSWRLWKVLLGADTPKYLVCLSFASKGDMEDVRLEELFELFRLKEILRNQKQGWARLKMDLSYGQGR